MLVFLREPWCRSLPLQEIFGNVNNNNNKLLKAIAFIYCHVKGVHTHIYHISYTLRKIKLTILRFVFFLRTTSQLLNDTVNFAEQKNHNLQSDVLSFKVCYSRSC